MRKFRSSITLYIDTDDEIDTDDLRRLGDAIRRVTDRNLPKEGRGPIYTGTLANERTEEG